MKGIYLIIGSMVIAAGILYFVMGPKSTGENNTGDGTSGIMGEVRLGPTCPTRRAEPGDDECADKLYQTNLVVMDEAGTRVIKAFSSDKDGKFKISLPVGEYVIRNAEPSTILPSCGKSGSVPVELNEYTDVIVFCDTGIR